jgi:hypothetical protein
MTGESGAVTRICERLCHSRSKSVHHVSRLGLVQRRPQPASRFSAAWDGSPGSAVETAIVRTASADSLIVEAQDEGADDGVMEAPDPGCCGSGRYARPAGVRNVSLRVDSCRPALTGHGRGFPADFGPQGGHHLAGCAFRFARRRHDAGKPLSGAKRRPDSPLTY